MTIMIKLYIPNDSYSSEIFTSHTLATIGIKWSLISPTPNFSSHLNNTLSFSFSISQPSLSKLPALQKMYFSVINGSYSGTELSRLIIYIRQTVVCEEWRGSGEGVLKKKIREITQILEYVLLVMARPKIGENWGISSFLERSSIICRQIID